MTLLELRTRTLQRLDEDTAAPVTYSAAEVNAALNEGQQLFVLLTLCLEKTVTFPLVAGVGFYRMLQTYADWIAPLRIALAGGTKLKPSRLQDLDALDRNWTSASGTVERYGCIGFDHVFIWRKPLSGSLTITYACAPATMALDTDTPEIPAEFHPLLIEYALYRVRMKLGAGEFALGIPSLRNFIEEAAKLAAQMRTRAVGLRYDTLPFELDRADTSRLLKGGEKT